MKTKRRGLATLWKYKGYTYLLSQEACKRLSKSYDVPPYYITTLIALSLVQGKDQEPYVYYKDVYPLCYLVSAKRVQEALHSSSQLGLCDLVKRRGHGHHAARYSTNGRTKQLIADFNRVTEDLALEYGLY